MPHCTWVFKHSSVKPHKKGRKEGNYVRIYGRCKRTDCGCCLRIVVKEVPVDPSEELTFHITRHGTPDHEGSPGRRPLKGTARAKAAEATVRVGAYNVRKDMLIEASEDHLKEGDFT